MSFSVADILKWTGGRIANEAELEVEPASVRLENVSPLGRSRASDLAFFFSRTFEAELPTASPGLLITAEDFVAPMRAAGLPFWKKTVVLACADPLSAMAILSEKFASIASSVAHLDRPKGEVHPSACVHPKAELGANVQVGPHCVIEEGVKIGAGTVLYAGCFVGPRASIGEDCVLFPNVTIYEWTRIGNRVRIHAGSVLGADGFGYTPILQGKAPIGHRKIYHLGSVVIEDDVEIGANATIDRGTLGETRVEKQVKIDDKVHIGHNCRIKEGAIICGVVGIAGSVTIGRYAYIGGMAGIIDHVHVGDGAKVGACSLISKDIPPGETAVGNPQRGYYDHFRAQAALNKLSRRKSSKSEKS